MIRPAALAAVVAGAAVSLGLMLRAGQRNGATIPLVLLVLFTGWVLSPFIAMLVAEAVSKGRPAAIRTRLHVTMLIVTLGSLAFYTGLVPMPAKAKTASVFLMVPLGAWVILLAIWAFLRRPGRQVL